MEGVNIRERRVFFIFRFFGVGGIVLGSSIVECKDYNSGSYRG